MLRVFFLLGCFLIIKTGLWSQVPGMYYCGQAEERTRRLQQHPELEEESKLANIFLDTYTKQLEESRGGGDELYIVPIVFHVIHNNGPENISDEQILDGLSILNRDFRKQNEDITDVVNEFAGITADINIEFRLATYDPNGECTKGINRIQSTLTNFGNEQMKSLIFWPRNKYLNVWICADASGAAGYTNMPGDVNSPWDAASDGIVIRADYVGSIGTSSITKSRTLTHEAGHWLNLHHCWGSSNTPELPGNCSTDDLVSDTPNTIGYYSCNLNGHSCGSPLDNVQNYMEYSFCTRMFTQGQRTRMRAAINSPIAQRNQLITQNNLINTGAINPSMCFVDFIVSKTAGCTGEEIQFTDESYHGVTGWVWNFGDGTTISGSDPVVYQNPVHIYSEPGTYTVTLTVSNSQGSLFIAKNNYIRIIGPDELDTPIIEGFESSWPANKWLLENQDGNYTWEVSPSAHYSGSKALKLRNFNNTAYDNSDALISTTIDMSGMDTVYLSYRWAYANKTEATDDRLRVSVSSDCGDHWSLKRNRRGLTNLPTAPGTASAFTPSGISQWSGETVVIDEPSMMTNMFRVKFEFLGRGGNNIFLDDINIESVGDGTSVMNFSRDMSFRVYPNPSRSDMVLEIDLAGHSPLRITLLNSIGQLCDIIADTKIPLENRFIIPAKPPGVYLLVIEHNGQRSSRRVIFE
ncbi:MAG: PKD domain-containing protein [Crocinitomicaceae bacterium]|nr:PKD domain-containing protein [Crocinitomicaceae bacterium]